MGWHFRHHNEDSSSHSRDFGEGSISYVAAIFLVASVTAAVATSGVGDTVAAGTQRAICRVAGLDCESVDAPQAAPSQPLEGQRRAGAQALPPNTVGGPAQTTQPNFTAPETPDPQNPPQNLTFNHDDVDYMNAIWAWQKDQGIKVKYRSGGGNGVDVKKKEIWLDKLTREYDRITAYREALRDIAGIPELNVYDPDPLKVKPPDDEKFIRDNQDTLATYYIQTIKLRKRLRELNVGKVPPGGIFDSSITPSVIPNDVKVYEDIYNATEKLGGNGAEKIRSLLRPSETQRLKEYLDYAYDRRRANSTGCTAFKWTC